MTDDGDGFPFTMKHLAGVNGITVYMTASS
jgi:hypothetical protein